MGRPRESLCHRSLRLYFTIFVPGKENERYYPHHIDMIYFFWRLT